MKRLRASIRNIRRADDSVRRRFYYGGAFLAMLIVIGGWLIFVQIYPPLPRAQESTETKATKENGTTPSTFALGFQTIQENMGRLWEKNQKALEERFGNVSDELSKTRDIVIEVPEENFYFENRESFPTTTLPQAPKARGVQQ